MPIHTPRDTPSSTTACTECKSVGLSVSWNLRFKRPGRVDDFGLSAHLAVEVDQSQYLRTLSPQSY